MSDATRQASRLSVARALIARRLRQPLRIGWVGKVAEVVRRLDAELVADEVHVIQLQYADARYVAGILTHLFAGERLARPPVIVADPRTNSLVIRARQSELKSIGRLLGHE